MEILGRKYAVPIQKEGFNNNQQPGIVSSLLFSRQEVVTGIIKV